MDGRNSKGQFAKGNSGGGRKRIPREIYDTFMANTKQAVQSIVSIMNDDSVKPELRLKAAMFIVQKGCGNALATYQGYEVDKDLNPLAHMLDD